MPRREGFVALAQPGPLDPVLLWRKRFALGCGRLQELLPLEILNRSLAECRVLAKFAAAGTSVLFGDLAWAPSLR